MMVDRAKSSSKEKLHDSDTSTLHHFGCLHIITCAWSFAYIGIVLSVLALVILLNFVITIAGKSTSYSDLYFFEKVWEIILTALSTPILFVDLIICIASILLCGSIFVGIYFKKTSVLVVYFVGNFCVIVILLTTVILNLSGVLNFNEPGLHKDVLNGLNIFFIILDILLMFLVYEVYYYIRNIQSNKNGQPQVNTILISENGVVVNENFQNAHI